MGVLVPCPKFSVIVPAHNSAKYIRKLLESIRQQSFTDYELIVVCDSCDDDTAEIAQCYADKVYEVNYGQDGQTRNFGIEHATGEWILFADDDDWFLHEFVFEMLAEKLDPDKMDILMFSFIWKGRGYTRNVPRIWVAVWNKCWKRSFIGDVRFSDVKYESDVAFHFGMMKKEPRIVNWDTPMYYYNFMREGSQSKEMQDKGIAYQGKEWQINQERRETP